MYTADTLPSTTSAVYTAGTLPSTVSAVYTAGTLQTLDSYQVANVCNQVFMTIVAYESLPMQGDCWALLRERLNVR